MAPVAPGPPGAPATPVPPEMRAQRAPWVLAYQWCLPLLPGEPVAHVAPAGPVNPESMKHKRQNKMIGIRGMKKDPKIYVLNLQTNSFFHNFLLLLLP